VHATVVHNVFTPMNLHTYDHYGYALVALLGTFAAAWAVLKFMGHPAFKTRLLSLRGVAPPFINIVGVLFGLTLAFIANDTWNAHDKATSSVYREADELRSLVVLSGSLPEPVRTEFRQQLTLYAQASAQEWEHLGRRQSNPQADALSASLLLGVVSNDVAQAVGGNVQALMLKAVNDIRQARDLRISLSQTQVNPRAAAATIVLFALSAAPTAAIVLIQGNPFQQPSFLSPQPILAAVGLG
jgi:hypothetical protein